MGRSKYISADVINAQNDRQKCAIINDWVVLSEENNKRMLKFYSNTSFMKSFMEDDSPFDVETSKRILQAIYEGPFDAETSIKVLELVNNFKGLLVPVPA